MSSKTYLSIGDVLTLLREEFPDVTISKIRFLESQGLVNPERSPSGYRKFFDHDVERLRWVLRQQREHFLPLKVIRDRLADEEVEGGGPGNGKPAVRQAAGSTGPAAADHPTKADEEAMARILADASRRTAQLPEEAPSRRGLQVLAEREAAPGTPPAPAAASGRPATEPAGPVNAGTGRGRAGPGATGSPEAGAPPRGNGTHLGAREARTSARTGAQRPARKTPTPAPAARGTDAGAAGGMDSGAAGGMDSGASLNLEELCGTSGLSAEEVAGLESFGLVRSVTVAGIATYDEDALTVANLAASFRSYGIEPRHLRLYRNAVDRELGLIEQIVIPLLRQRNPEARQKAAEAAHELAALGQSMRATLLQLALRQHLGG